MQILENAEYEVLKKKAEERDKLLLETKYPTDVCLHICESAIKAKIFELFRPEVQENYVITEIIIKPQSGGNDWLIVLQKKIKIEPMILQTKPKVAPSEQPQEKEKTNA